MHMQIIEKFRFKLIIILFLVAILITIYLIDINLKYTFGSNPLPLDQTDFPHEIIINKKELDINNVLKLSLSIYLNSDLIKQNSVLYKKLPEVKISINYNNITHLLDRNNYFIKDYTLIIDPEIGEYFFFTNYRYKIYINIEYNSLITYTKCTYTHDEANIIKCFHSGIDNPINLFSINKLNLISIIRLLIAFIILIFILINYLKLKTTSFYNISGLVFGFIGTIEIYKIVYYNVIIIIIYILLSLIVFSLYIRKRRKIKLIITKDVIKIYKQIKKCKSKTVRQKISEPV